MTNASADTPTGSPALRFLLACAIFAAAVLIVFGDVLFKSGQVVSSAGTDICGQFYAWRQFGFDELSRGHLALWNPSIFCGAPYFGGFQSALLYPPNWLYLIIPMPAAINVGAALHIFMAGIFMYCWAAYRRLHWLACVAAGLVFMCGGPEMGQLLAGHLPNACAIVWAPLIFLALDDLAITASPRAVFLGCAAVALQVLSGHPQYVFFTAVAAGLYVLLNLITTPHRLKLIGGFVACYLCGALLSAVQLLTGLQATSEAMRTRLSYEIASTFSFPPENLLTLVLPRFFGDRANVPYWGRWFYWEMSAFIGVTAVVLVIFAIAVPRRQRRFGFIMLLLMLLLALGRYTPIGSVIFRLPGFASFRGISKFMFLFLMFLSMLAGMGFDWLLRGGRIRRGYVEYIGGAALLFIVAAITITVSAKSEFSGWWGQMLRSNNWTYHPIHFDVALLHQTADAAAKDLWWAAGACILVGAILVIGRRNPTAHAALAAVLAVELIVFARGVHSSFPLAELQNEANFISQNFGDSTSDTRTWTYEQGSFLLAHRLDSWGDDPMMLRRYVELMAGAFPNGSPDELLTQMKFPDDGAQRDPDGNVSVNLRAPAWNLTRTGWVLVSANNQLIRAVNRHTILPRARLIGNVQVVSDRAQLVSKLSDRDFDPGDTALVESPVSLPAAGEYGLGHVDVHDIDSDTLEIEATTNSPCLLLITDAYSSGWHAEALPDSAEKKYDLIPTDLAFRGIPLATPGHHHLRVVYRPTAFVIGAWVTVASLIAYVAALMFWLGRRHFMVEMPDEPIATAETRGVTPESGG